MSVTAKDQIRLLLDELPEDASYQEIEYFIYLRGKVDLGLDDIRQGHHVEQAQVEQRMTKWLDR